jgi:hypothetical protein
LICFDAKFSSFSPLGYSSITTFSDFFYDFKDFKSFIKAVLHSRRLRNPRHSLRAFARDIGISNSRLSHVLSSDEGISIKSAQRIAKGLQLNRAETEYFVNLVISECGRTWA